MTSDSLTTTSPSTHELTLLMRLVSSRACNSSLPLCWRTLTVSIIPRYLTVQRQVGAAKAVQPVHRCSTWDLQILH